VLIISNTRLCSRDTGCHRRLRRVRDIMSSFQRPILRHRCRYNSKVARSTDNKTRQARVKVVDISILDYTDHRDPYPGHLDYRSRGYLHFFPRRHALLVVGLQLSRMCSPTRLLIGCQTTIPFSPLLRYEATTPSTPDARPQKPPTGSTFDLWPNGRKY